MEKYFNRKIVKSYNEFNGGIEEINLSSYTNDIIELEINYQCDLLFLDTIRQNARKLGYIYERSLNTLDYEESLSLYCPEYEKLTVFTKVDTENNDIFPEEKIAVYRASCYFAETDYHSGSAKSYLHPRKVFNNPSAKMKYDEFLKLFCGKKGFDYYETDAINPINTILIVIVDAIGLLPDIFAKLHKNFVLFCIVSSCESKGYSLDRT